MCRTGRPVADPSNASAVRVPVPVMITESALPLAQPVRLTICWTTDERFGVRWSTPRAPTVDQGAGAHAAFAVVLCRFERLLLAVVKVPGLSATSAATVRLAAAVDTSSTWNCT